MSKSKCHCDECLYGDGIFDYIKNVISPNKSVESENIIKKYWGWYVKQIAIHRSPVEKVLQKILNLISLGKFNKEKEKKNYDDVFHLYMILELWNPKTNEIVYLQTEKEPNINYKKVSSLESKDSKGDSIKIKLSRPCDFRDVIQDTKMVMGDKFYTYSNPHNNCQTYIFMMVHSMYKIMNEEMPKSITDYILQDVSDLVTGTTRSIANTITSIGHLFGRLLGKGIYGGNLYINKSKIIYNTKGFI